MAVPSGGNTASLTVAGRTFTDLTNLIILKLTLNANSNGTFRKSGATAGYQVTAGKTLKIYAVRTDVNVVAAGNFIQLGYGDTDVGISSAVAPTNQVIEGGGNAIASGSNAVITETATDFAIPSGKYPSLVFGSSTLRATVVLFGYET